MADGWEVIEELPDAAPAPSASAAGGGWDVVEETMPAAFGVKPRGIRTATNAPAPDKTDLTDAIGGAISAVVRPPKPDFKAANELAREQVQPNPNATSLSGAELRQQRQGRVASDTFASDPWRAVGATVESTPGMARSIMGGALRAIGEGPLAKIGGETGAIDPTGEFQGTVNTLGDMVARFGIDVADQGRAIEEEANKGIKRGLGGQVIDTAYRSALMAIPAAVVGIATRSPALVVSLMAGQDGALSYEEARQKGLDPTQAGGYAFLHALIEGGTEYIPMKELMRGDKNLLRHTLMFLAKEQPSEMAATTLQSGLDKLTINPNMTAREFANELMMTALSTPLSAGAQTGAMRGIQTMLGAPDEAPQPLAPQAPPPAAIPPATPPQPNPASTAAADLRSVMADARPLEEIRAEQAQQAQAEEAAQQDAIRQEAGFPDIGAPMIAKTPAGPLSGAVESIQQGETGPLAVFRTADGDVYRFAAGEVQFDAPTGDGTRAAPVVARDAQDVAIAAKVANTEATPGQKLADNYRKGWFQFDDTTPMVGLGKIAIETPKGSTRVAADGSWSVPDMPYHYGHLSIAKGNDGDGADIAVGDKLDAPYVYVIDQIDPDTGKYDETKSFAGFGSEGEAIGAYVRSFSDGKGPARIGAVTRMPLRQFVARARADNLKNAVAYRQNTIDPKEIARERKPNPARGVADAVMRRTEIDDTSLARMLDKAIEGGNADQVQALAEESIRRGHNFTVAEEKAIDTIVKALAKDQPAVTAAAEAAANSPEPQDAALMGKLEEIANAEPENQAPAGTGRGEVQTAEAPATGATDEDAPQTQPQPAPAAGDVGADELRLDGRGISEIPDGELRQIAGKTRTPKVLKAISDELAKRRKVQAPPPAPSTTELEQARVDDYRKNKVGARAPHEMSLVDWSKEWAADMEARTGEKVSPKAIGAGAHLDFIESALEEGKSVPDEAFKGHKAIDAKNWPLAAARMQPNAPAPAKPTALAPKGKHANMVIRQVRDRNGTMLGTVMEPYDGTIEGARKAAEAVTKRMYDEFPDAGNVASRMGATDEAGNPKWAISPNFAYINPVDSLDGRATFGDADAIQQVYGPKVAKDVTPAAPKKPAKKVARKDPLVAIREHFTPGNIVFSSYWREHDRVLAFRETENGGWEVQVEKVAKKSKDGPWEATQAPRWHATAPDAKDVVVERAAPAVPAEATAPQEPAEIGGFAKGEMVTFSVPGPKGQMRIGGRIDRVMPTGAYEVRSQQGGIYILMAGDMMKVSKEMVPQIEQDIADAQWWDKELTHVGRKRVLKAAKLPNLPDSIQWQRLSGQEMRAVRANRAAADVEETPAAPPKQSSDRKEIGKNRDGATLYEDWRGVRTLVQPGETAGTTETVQMRPTRSGMQIVVMNSSQRPAEYKTVEELEAEGQQDELPAEMRAYEAKAEAAEKAPSGRRAEFKLSNNERARVLEGAERGEFVVRVGDSVYGSFKLDENSQPTGFKSRAQWADPLVREAAGQFAASQKPAAKAPSGMTLQQARDTLTVLEKQAAAQGRVADSRLEERIRNFQKLVADMEAEAAPKEPAKSPDQLRAEADLMAGLADLADIFGKNAKLNMAPEQQQKIGPVLTRVFDAAFRLGYIKFKQAAKFVLDTIRTRIGADIADQITIDDLQGAYIGMAQNYKDKGADPGKVVVAVESLADLETAPESAQNAPQEPPNAAPQQSDAGPGSLEGEGAGPVSPTGSEPADAGVRAGEGDGAGGATGKKPRRAPRKAPPAEPQPQGGLFGEGAEPQPDRVDRDGAGDSDGAGLPDQRPSRNYRIADSDLTYEGSWLQKARNNLDIIQLAKQLEQEGRAATPEEQAQLVKYTGFGASDLAQNLFTTYSQHDRSPWKPLAERLRALLTEEEYQTAARSTQYAHYTSAPIIRSMWRAAARLGFAGGMVMEPGMGIGLFPGLMPAGMAKSTRYTGIEYDGITGLIAKHLFPDFDIKVEDFSHTELPDNFYDLAVGNPPFSSVQVTNDPRYKKRAFSLHDYFFAKSIDRVRPGGLVIFVTSNSTMDKASDKARSYLDDRAILLGAIRLPRTAFQANAGTEVVTDVLFLQKRVDGMNDTGGQPWLGSAEVDTPEGKTSVNEYFAAHPEMVLGTHSLTGKMYRAGQYTVLPREGEDIEAAFDKAIENMPKGVFQPARGSKAEKAVVDFVDFNPKAEKDGNYYLGDKGALLIRESGVGKPVDMGPKANAILKSFVPLRDALKQAQYDQLNDGDWEASLKALNKAYDGFVKQHGHVNQFTTQERTDKATGEVTESRRYGLLKTIADDPDWTLVAALERINDETGAITKSNFLTERTLKRPDPPKIETLHDALNVVLDQRGDVDIDAIAALMGVTPAQAIDGLGDAIFEEPGRGWQTADRYLSGKVRIKLAQAEAAALVDKRFERNVTALKAAQPVDVAPSGITARLGAPWVDPADIGQFVRDVMQLDATVTHDDKTGHWSVKPGYLPGVEGGHQRATSDWGTGSRTAWQLLDAALNKNQVKITYTDSDKKVHTDEKATAAANEKLRKINEAFTRWIWTEGERTDRLVKVYNERYNDFAPRKFNGDHLTLPGVSAKIKLRPHQKRAVWRIIQTGNTYVAHAVGAGKTMEMIAAGMEMRRLGIVRKPIYAVPNHMLQQFAREFLQLYPAAQIMVADETNFHTDNRRRFMARAALSNIDAIITTHSSFNMIDVKPEFKNSIINEQLDILRDALEDVPKDERARRKQIERQIEALEKRLQGNLAGEGKDKNLTFEDMGVDFMFVDEAHEFRKLDFATNMGNIKGISPAGSAKAMNLYIKVRLLESKNPGRSLVLASGTPVTNTMAELFTLQRFMQPGELESKGIDRFDAWASMFGVEASDIEATAAGNYEPVTRFSKFINLPELASMFREFADIITGAELGGLVDRPTVKGGGRQVNVTPRIPELVDFQEELKRRMVAIRARKGPPKAGDDILLSVIGDGRLASIDMRFVRPGLPSNPESKLNKLIDSVIETYRATEDMEFKDAEGNPDPQRGATQLIFSDIGFGAGVAATRGFDGRAWLLKRLTEAGIAREQIAFMSDFDTSVKKQRLFNDMNGGRKRILIGSSKNMGTGTNVQRRLAALHHLDAPWYPADIEQREGRAVRQGNQNPEVSLEAYATKGSYDTTMWQMVARKQRFIDQVMRGDPNVRAMEDLGEASQYEMATALSSGDERIIRLAGLRADVEKLERLYAAHQDAQGRLRGDLRYAFSRIEWAEKRIVALKKDLAQSTSLAGDAFRMTVDGTVHKERAEAGKALIAKYRRLRADFFDGSQTIGHAGGFDIAFHGTIKRDKKGDIVDYFARADLQMGAGDVDLINDVDADPVGTVMRVQNAIGGLPRRIADEESTIAAAKREIPQLESRIGGQFEFQQELAEKRAEVADIENALRAENEAAKNGGSAALTNFEALYGKMEGADLLGPYASRTARPGYAPPYTRPEAYRFQTDTDANGLPRFRSDAVSLANARVKDALGVPKGGRAIAFDIFDQQMPDAKGRPTLVGSVLVHMDAAGKFTSFRNISIKKEFRDRGYYHGEGTVLGMLQHNGATAMEVYNIQSAARGDEDDALPFWKKIGTTILNYSTTQDVDIEGNISLARYLDAAKKRSTDYAKRQAGDARAAQGAGGRNGAATGRTNAPGTTGARVRGQRAGLSIAEVQRVAQGFSSRLVRVVQSTADLPESAARFKSDEGGIRGVFIPATDEIYLIADNLHSPLEVAFVVMHEGLHRGLRAFFGADIAPILGQIANTNAKVRKATAEYMAKYDIGRMEAIEEVLADMALAGSAKDLTGWEKLVAFIRKWAAALGGKLGFQLRFSDDMVEMLVGAAARRGLQDEPTAFDDAVAARYSEAAPTFYSALAAEVARINARALTPQAWWQNIESWNKKGVVKNEELQWSEVEGWLSLQSGKVTKEQFLGFLRENGVKVETTVLGLPGSRPTLEARLFKDVEDPQRVPGHEYAKPDSWVVFANGQPYFVADEGSTRSEALQQYSEAADDAFGDEQSSAKFGSYKLPGGEDYREVLMTLPSSPEVVNVPAGRGPYEVRQSDGKWYIVDRYGEWGEVGYDTRAAAETQIPAPQTARIERDPRAIFQSGHWDQPNVVAHFRADVVTGADGKRYLRPFEFQSDWGQLGKKQGFKGMGSDRVDQMVARANVENRELTQAERDEIDQIMQSGEGSRNGGVPKAPFVTKTEAWLALAIKRAIRMAADEGLDGVVFANGEQMADLFDLSKQISRVQFDDNSSGGVGLPNMDGPTKGGMLTALDLSGKEVISKRVESEQEVADLVGKDVARKLLEQPAKQARYAGLGVRRRLLEGLDLKVGGEGMRAFYDKIVPNVANDVLRKLGGGKVGVVELQGMVKPRLVVAPRGDGTFTLLDLDANVGSAGEKTGSFPTRQAAVEALEAAGKSGQPGFLITDTLRERALGGMPLFSRLSGQLKGMNKDAGGDLFKGAVELDGKVADVTSDDEIEPRQIIEVHPVRDQKKASDLAGTMADRGWQGRPVLAWDSGNGIFAFTGSHRIAAARKADIMVPVAYVDADAIARQLEAEGLTADELIGSGDDRIEDFFRKAGDARAADMMAEELRQNEPDARDDSAQDDLPLASRAPDDMIEAAAADLQPPRRGSFDNPFGGDAEFAGDLSLFKRIAVHPRTIAALDAEFAPVYAVAESQVERRDQLAADILRHAQPYFDLNGEQKARVNAVLELGRLQGMTYGHDGTVQVMNMADSDAALSQPDDVLLLSPAEVRGYKAARKAMDRALDLFAERMIAEYGYTGQVRTAEEAATMSIEMAESNPRESGRLARLAEILFEVEQAKRTGYVPFTRWGEVGIAIKNAAGQQIAFERVEVDQWSNKARGMAEGLIPSLFNTRRLGSIPQVKERLAALKTRYPEGRVSVFRMDNPSAAGQVDLAAVDILASVSNIDPGQWDRVRAELEKAKQTTGFRKHFMGSRNVPGYSTDFERALADYILGISGYLSRHEHTPKWEQAIGAIDSAKSKLIDYASRYRDYVNKPHEELQGLRQAAFFYFLSGVPATAMVNLTQVPLITMPYLTQFASATRVNMELARGYASAMAMLTTGKGVEMFDPAKAPPDMMDAFENAWEQGFFVPLQTYEIMGLAQNRTPIARGLSKVTRTVVDVVSLMFSLAERLNRIATFIAAYRLAATEGFGENARRIMADNPLAQQELADFTPEAFAEWAIDETHYRMGKVNRPEAMRGVGAAVLQFKGFMLNTLELYHRIGTLHGAEGKQAEAMMILLLLLASGMYGLPGADDIADLIEFLMKRWKGIDYDTKARARQAIAELTGSPKIAEAMLHGAPRLAGGPDLASRLSMGNVVPNTMKDVAGVPLSLTVGKAVQAAEYAGRGQGMLAAAELMPNFIKNPMTAYVWGREGIRAQGTGKVAIPAEKVSAGQQAMKAIGFTPAKVAETREMQYSINRLEHAADERRKAFYTRMAKAQGEVYRAQQAGDAAKLATAREAVEKVMREVMEWNAEASMENQVHFDAKTLRERVRGEIMGPDAQRRRKQARGSIDRLKDAYGQD